MKTAARLPLLRNSHSGADKMARKRDERFHSAVCMCVFVCINKHNIRTRRYTAFMILPDRFTGRGRHIKVRCAAICAG